MHGVNGALFCMLFSATSVFASPPGLDGSRMSRVLQPITDDRSEDLSIKGSSVVLFKDRRVSYRESASGATAYDVVARTVEKLSARDPLLVFNRGLGQYGLVTGEIVIKFRTRESASEFPVSEFYGFKKLGNLDMYIVQASSPDEFAIYFKKLSLRKDLLWVEPTIRYVSGLNLERSKL